MIVIFANSTTIHMGGVEIFNEELESLFKDNNIEFYRAPSLSSKKFFDYGYRILHTIFFVFKNYKKIDFIIVQYGNFLDILSIPLLKLSFKKIRIIAHVGDSWKHIKDKNMRSLTNNILRIFVQQVYIITDEQRTFLVHKNMKKIHTMINKKYRVKEKIDCRDEKYLLFLGRICPEKGIDDLIAVYSELNKTLDLPILKIVGPVETSYLKHINNLLVDNGIINKVFILDPIYNVDEKINLIDNAIVLVYPSYADAFPLTVIESFSRGTCCIATAISETKNFIEFNEFLFAPGDLIAIKDKLQMILLNQNLYIDKVIYMQNKSIKYADGAIINDIFMEGER